MSAHDSAARIIVRTAGVWKAHQLADTILALDGLTSRVAIAAHIAETCQQFDYVISNFRALGLLQKGAPENWEKAQTPTDFIGRTDWTKFVSLMRTMGVGIQLAPDSLKFNFLVPDLLELIPASSRPEIERIKMASPGTLALLLTGVVGGKQSVKLLEKIFDFLVSPKSAIAERRAKAREAKANARTAEAKAKHQEAVAASALVKAHKEAVHLLYDYSAAVDSLTTSLRNAGFQNNEIKTALHDKVTRDIDVLCRYKSIGLIENVKIKPLALPGGSGHPPADNIL